MNKKIIQLQKEFERISKKGYIKGIYNCNSSLGRTFENELGIPLNKECEPDYHGIELKTRKTYSKSPMTLFSAVPDVDRPLEVERIKEIYGYPYKKDKRYKAIYFDAYGNKLSFGGLIYQYKLDVDRVDEKIYLCIYDKNNNMIERKTYWSFKYLKEKLMQKLKYLAIINAWTMKKDNWNYFKYYKIEFYKLKNFDKFLELIEDGIIRLEFKVDIHTDELNYGKTYDHGCSFRIKEEDITKLFNKYIPRSND